MSTTAWGVGIATLDTDGATLEVRFRALGLGEMPHDPPSHTPTRDTDPLRGVALRPVALTIDLASAPTSAEDAYLRLNLLSHRFVKPRTINLDGMFGTLQNVAWTSRGPVALSAIESVTWNFAQQGEHLVVHGVDKFPRMTDYVIPSGVRIADASRVRLGAYLSEGTTVMHEGFCNFNAGTLGASMVEGRISQGVIVGDGSDIGGGASIMGTLSGGGKEMVSIGERCLLGANAGLGISLGDDCIVEAGLYVTAGTVVIDPAGNPVKAKQLSGQSGLLYRRNSLTGAVEVISRTGSWGGLNADLHKN
ncbi:MAG: tetrahydrodipicolinate N-succinyltransferase [Actinomycetota bacterium]|jgi:2,3,4,5-tetrahydropyridine-2-carboxylate N-succinyltransferase